MLIPWALYKKNFNFPLFSLLCISIATQFTAQESTWIGFHYLSQAFQVRLQFSSGLSKNCFVPTLTETQNHRRANAGRGFLWWSCPKPPVKVGSITADCSGSCPISGFNIFRDGDTRTSLGSLPQPLTTYAVFAYMGFPMLQSVPIAFCPVAGHHWAQSSCHL